MLWSILIRLEVGEFIESIFLKLVRISKSLSDDVVLLCFRESFNDLLKINESVCISIKDKKVLDQ